MRVQAAVQVISVVLGEAVGQIYVARHFRPEAKHRMDQLVANLMKTYESSIHSLTWMTDATKVQALDKLHKMTPRLVIRRSGVITPRWKSSRMIFWATCSGLLNSKTSE